MLLIFDNVLFLYVRARRAEKTMMQLSGGLQSRSGRFRSFQHNQSRRMYQKSSLLYLLRNSSDKRKNSTPVTKYLHELLQLREKLAFNELNSSFSLLNALKNEKAFDLEKIWKTREEAGNELKERKGECRRIRIEEDRARFAYEFALLIFRLRRCCTRNSRSIDMSFAHRII